MHIKIFSTVFTDLRFFLAVQAARLVIMLMTQTYIL